MRLSASLEVGSPEIVARDLVVDDFCIMPSGDLLLTTHVHSSLMRLAPDGARQTLAGPSELLDGCTSVVACPTVQDAYLVTTTGGILTPRSGKVAEAALLRFVVPG